MATDHNFKVKKGLDVLGGDVNLGDGFAYKIDGTTVVDSSRNLSNIGTISSGAITADGTVIVDGGTGVDSTGIFHVRQSGDGDGNGIALTSSNATSHRIWKDANGVLNIGSSSNSNAFQQDVTGNVTLEGTLSSGTITSSGNINASSGHINTANQYLNGAIRVLNSAGDGWNVFANRTSAGIFDLSSIGTLSTSGTVSSGGSLTVNGANLILASNISGDGKLYFSGHGGASNYNYFLKADNDTGRKAVMFVNGSTRTADGGANTFTVRNDGGPSRFGNSAYVTTLEGSTIKTNGTTQVVASEFQVTSGSAYTTHLNYQNNGQNYISQGNSGLTQFRNSSGTLMEIAATGNVTISNDLTVSGNLTISGTTTTLNTATLQVEDKNIVLNYGTGNTVSTANGAGITIQDAMAENHDATILWDTSNDRFNFSDPINVGLTGANQQPGTDSLNVAGYGIIGNRGALYLTNANSNGTVQIGVGGAHNANPKLTVSSAAATFTVPVTSTALTISSSDAQLKFNAEAYKIKGGGYYGDIRIVAPRFRVYEDNESSTAKFQIDGGNATFAGSVTGTYFLATGGDSTPGGTGFSNVFKGSNARTVYFDSGDGSSISTWYGSGNTPFAAIDANNGILRLYVNNTSGSWNERIQMNSSGITHYGTTTVIANNVHLDSTGSAYYRADGATNSWKYLSLQTNGSTNWDIATKNDDLSGALQFRPSGGPTNRTSMSTAGDWTFGGRITVGDTAEGQKVVLNFDSGGNMILGNDGSYGATGNGRYTTLGFGGTTNGVNRIFAHNGTADGMYFAAATGQGFYWRPNGSGTNEMQLSSSGLLTLGGGEVRIGQDSSYGNYATIGFGGTGNGSNRIFAHKTGGDGLFLTSATSRHIYFRTNGSANETFRMSATGDFQMGSANTTVIDASRNLTNIGTITNSGKISSSIGSNATYSKPLLEITTSATPTQIKITTNIPYSGSGASTHAHSVTIRGFQYGSAQMADLQIGWHVYLNQFYQRSVTSSGSWAPTVTLAVENNKVVIHLASPGYWPKLYVESMYNAYGGAGQASGWSWSDAAISADANTPNVTVPYKFDYGNGVLMSGGTTVIDSSRNLTNIGTISSGTISSGEITATGRSTFDSVTIDDDGSSSPLLRVVADNHDPWAFQIENSSATNSGLFQAYVNNANNLYFRARETGAYPTWYFQISNGSNHVTSMYLNSSGINGAGHVDVASYKVNTTTVIDSSRNLTNIGTISSGAITSSGNSVFTGGNSDGTGNAFEIKRGGNSQQQAIRVQNTGEVVVSNNYLYAAHTGTSFYSQGDAVFRATIRNDTSGMPVKVSDDFNVTGDIQSNGTVILQASGRNLTNIGTISSGAITSSGDITTTADIYINGGRAIFDTDTGTQPFQLNRIGIGTTHNQNLRMWVDDSYAVYESDQDETNRYGGHMFRSKHGSTAYTRLQITAGSTSEVLMYNNTGTATWQWDGNNSRQGINKLTPAYTLDVNGIISGSSYRVGATEVINSSGQFTGGLNPSSLSIGGTTVIDSSRNLTNINTLELKASNSSNKWIAYTYTDNTYRINYNGAGADEFIIDSDGRVGIGTTSLSSGYKLNVSGNLNMNNSHIHYANEVHFNSGTRFKTLNTSTTLHRSNHATSSSIALDTNGTIRGYVGGNSDSGHSVGLFDQGGNWGVRHINDQGTVFYADGGTQQAAIGSDLVSGGYGGMVLYSAKNGYVGYSLNNRAVFMHNNSTTTGIYNDVSDEWYARFVQDGAAELYHNGHRTLFTQTPGAIVDSVSGQSTVQIQFTTNGTSRGYVYGNSSSNFGFLDAGGNWAIRHVQNSGTEFRQGNTVIAGIGADRVGGSFGSMVVNDTKSGWGGYSINNRVVFMHDHGNTSGLYNDVNNHWLVKTQNGGEVELYHNGSQKLQTTSTGVAVTGNISHDGLTPTAGTDIDQLYTVTDSLTITTSWQDTSINSSELATGTYIMQLFINGDHGVGGSHYTEYYSGVISWYGGSTNSIEVDEIVLHRAGHAPNSSVIHLRTQRHYSGGDNLVLQIKGNYTMTAARNYVFKFRRMI